MLDRVKLATHAARAEPEPGESVLLGRSAAMRALRQVLGKLGPVDSPVLICGEEGTGKHLVAQQLHRYSSRGAGPFVCLNAQHMVADQVERALWGNGEASLVKKAEGGTLYIDEVGQLPIDCQGRLLRLLQEKRVRLSDGRTQGHDLRVLAGTGASLPAAIAAGSFREDLYYRLNVLQLDIAPLRERHGDVLLLAEHFAQHYCREAGQVLRRFSDSALLAMARYPWPGNVRELARRVRRGLMHAEQAEIAASDLGLDLLDEAQPLGTLEEYKHRAERQALRDVLFRHSDNLSVAARVLGVSRPTFYRLLHKHHLR